MSYEATVVQLEAVSQNTAMAKKKKSNKKVRDVLHPSPISVTIVSLSARTTLTAGCYVMYYSAADPLS